MQHKIIQLSKFLKNIEMTSEASYLDNLFLKVADSQSNIINLGYPPVLAKVFNEMFNKNAFLIAKWIKEYYARGGGEEWLDRVGGQLGHWRGGKITEMLGLYNAASRGPEEYFNFLKQNDYYTEDFDLTEADLVNKKQLLEAEMKSILKNDIFFYYSLPAAILSGKIDDLRPYKKLSFNDALEKYNKKMIFEDVKPYKVYPNGYKWINVGRKSELIGELMGNCGSVGAMSMDSEASAFVLFDQKNHPHIIATYSPNQNRLSGVEGKASSAPKTEYHSYILDLIKSLGVKFDHFKSDSKDLAIQYLYQDYSSSIEKLHESTYDTFYKITLNNGKTIYSTAYEVITEDKLNQIKNQIMSNTDLKDKILSNFGENELNLILILRTIFSPFGERLYELDIENSKIPIVKFTKQLAEEANEGKPKLWL